MDIICIANTGWDFLYMRPQQLMSRLSKKNRVLYLEEPISILVLIRNPKRILPKIRGNVIIFSPPGVPFGLSRKYNFFKKLNLFISLLSLKLLLKVYKFNNPILWFYNIELFNFAGKFDEKLVCYDCVDEFSAFGGSSFKVASIEYELIKRSDIVFTSSNLLFKNKGKLHNNVYLVPNGVDFKHFERAILDETLVAEEISKLPKPVVGYIGAIWDWLDLDLVEYIAVNHPEWSIVLIGHVNTDISRFNDIRNIHIMGKKAYLDLPKYIKGFDVCVIPFKINELTRNADPIKLYEYMASKKPIVSTNLPEVKKFKKFVKIAKTKEEFAYHISNYIAETDKYKEILEDETKAVKEHSWDARYKLMEKILWDTLKNKGLSR